MTIYFSGAISGGRADLALYQQIIEMLETEGYRVLAGALILHPHSSRTPDSARAWREDRSRRWGITA